MDVNVWNDNVERLGSVKKPNKTVVVSAVTGWLGTEVANDTEGRWEAVSRRTAWLFPDGWGFTVGTGFKPIFTHTTEKLNDGTLFPMPEFFNKNEWIFVPHINGWCYSASTVDIPAPETIMSFIDAFALEHGKPELILPWFNSWSEMVVDQGEGYYEYYDEDGEGEDNFVNVYKTMYKMCTLIKDDVLEAKSPWVVVKGDETDGLSEHSDFMRFQRLVNKIDDNNIMILDLDQHCAGCAHGMEKWEIENNPALEGKPTFRTWGQNSQHSWFGDGTIFVEAYNIEDSVTERRIKHIAEEEGLHMGVYEDDWEPSSDFDYSSPSITLALEQ